MNLPNGLLTSSSFHACFTSLGRTAWLCFGIAVGMTPSIENCVDTWRCNISVNVSVYHSALIPSQAICCFVLFIIIQNKLILGYYQLPLVFYRRPLSTCGRNNNRRTFCRLPGRTSLFSKNRNHRKQSPTDNQQHVYKQH